MLKKIRSKFLNYFQSKFHYVQESFPLIPQNDNSLLFINSGMAPLKPFFLNEKKPENKNIVSAQRCLRVGGKHNDLADIGYSKRHHTFFEMLGNFSFGGYFKSEAIQYTWDFLTNELKLDKDRLFVTVHPDDAVALDLWKQYIDSSKIVLLDTNIWKMGDTGPWGYCSEVFYDLQEGEGDFQEGDRYLEIWNIVFTQFCSDGVKDYNLDFPCIDTGMGLERIVSVLEGKTDNYEINFFKKVLPILNLTHHNSHSKIFLDHLRAVSFLIMEGLLPGATQESYILRRLIRRLLRSFYTFNLKLEDVVVAVLTAWSDEYTFEIAKIINVLVKENVLFLKTINVGLKRFFNMFENKFIKAQDIFNLHDTYGLTVDIVLDLVKEQNGTGEFAEFEQLMEQNKQKNEKLVLDYPATEFEEHSVQIQSKLLGVYKDCLIFDKSLFYAEGGGQVGDQGWVESASFQARIINTTKHNKVYLHQYDLVSGAIDLSVDTVTLKLNIDRRNRITAHHSSAHLLQYALETLYGEGIQQMGSFVNEVKFREDFSFPSDVVDLEKIQEEINSLVQENAQTDIRFMSLNEARSIGAKAFFEYDDLVRVVKVGPSLELCGGTHVLNTSQIFGVKVLKVSSVKSGVKRFEGVAGLAYLDYLKGKEEVLNSALSFLNCTSENLLKCLKKITATKMPATLVYSKNINGLMFGVVSGDDQAIIENLMVQFKLDVICLYIEKETKCSLKIKVQDSRLNAKELIQSISSIIKSKGGGGNFEFAQTGGEKQDCLEEIFRTLSELISQSTLKV